MTSKGVNMTTRVLDLGGALSGATEPLAARIAIVLLFAVSRSRLLLKPSLPAAGKNKFGA